MTNRVPIPILVPIPRQKNAIRILKMMLSWFVMRKFGMETIKSPTEREYQKANQIIRLHLRLTYLLWCPASSTFSVIEFGMKRRSSRISFSPKWNGTPSRTPKTVTFSSPHPTTHKALTQAIPGHPEPKTRKTILLPTSKTLTSEIYDSFYFLN